MSSHNHKKRKRVPGETDGAQVKTKQSAEHLVLDSPAHTVPSSSTVGSHPSGRVMERASSVNKRVRYNNGISNRESDGSDRDDASVRSGQRAEALKMAFARVQELQEELLALADDDGESDDDDWALETPEFVGFAVCMRESLAFLEAQGLSEDDPMVNNLKNSLIEAMPF